MCIEPENIDEPTRVCGERVLDLHKQSIEAAVGQPLFAVQAGAVVRGDPYFESQRITQIRSHPWICVCV